MAFIVALAAATFHGWAFGQGEAPESRRVRVSVSVDWEGNDLDPANLRAMETFREILPDVPLVHFLNAAYFTKAGADAGRISAQIRRVLREGDELGLHIHAWRSLVVRSGVEFRTGPTFWGVPVREGEADCGHDVELDAYEEDELRKVVRTSKEILTGAGFSLSDSFRAGGWIGSPRVLAAVRAEGFLIDSSATDPTWHDELEGLPLQARIRALWPNVTEASDPFWIETPHGTILEMPDTGALADYLTEKEMETHLRQALDRLRADPSRDVFVHVGFHQETARRYAHRVASAIRAVGSDPDASISFETLRTARSRLK